MSLVSELQRRNVIRVALAYLAGSWLLVQIAESLLPIYGFGDAAIRIVVSVLVIGLIPTIVFAWVFELTPEGLKKESEVDRSRSTTDVTGKRLDRIIIVALVSALVYFAFDKFVLSESRFETARQQGRSEALVESYGGKSIAVMAFDDLSPAGDQEYFSDGIAEELLNVLTKITELRVISRSSAFSYKGKGVKLTDAARELNVAHILEGSVRKSGTRIRITVQLIDARADTHIWSETYDRDLDDIFAIQDDIAEKVVEKLKVTLLDKGSEEGETDPEAYAMFLQANHLRRQSTPDSFEKAVELYKLALEIDADYVAAWDRLALLYCMQANFGLRPNDEGHELCRETTKRALAIDPDYAPSHSGLGWIAMGYDRDFAAAARHFEKALKLDPTNIAIIGDAAVLVQYLGRLDDAIVLTEYAIARDPVNPIGHANLGLRYRFAGRLDDAINSFNTAIPLSPDRIGAYYQLGVALLRNGEPQAALEEFRQEQSDDWRVMGSALAFYALGQQSNYESSLKELRDGWGEQWPTEVAQVYAWVGEIDEAFAWLEKGYDVGGAHSWPDIAVDDLLINLHDDPRWPQYTEKLGTGAESIGAVEFSVTLPN